MRPAERRILRGFRDRALADYLEVCVRAGWTIAVTGGDHIRMMPPDGGRPVSVSETQYSGKSTARSIARIRKAGGPDTRPGRARKETSGT